MAIPWSVGGLSEDVEGNTVDFISEAIAELDDGAVHIAEDMDVEIEQVFMDEVYEELGVTVAIW